MNVELFVMESRTPKFYKSVDIDFVPSNGFNYNDKGKTYTVNSVHFTDERICILLSELVGKSYFEDILKL